MRIKLVLFITDLLEKYFYTPKLLASLQSAVSLNPGNEKNLVIFDVGANKGQSIDFFTQHFIYKSIFAFEPDPNVFSQLKTFSIKSGVSLNNFALGQKNGKVSFYVSPLTVTSSLILPNQDSNWSRIKRRILGLSNENSFNEIDLLKNPIIDRVFCCNKFFINHFSASVAIATSYFTSCISINFL